MHKLGTLAPVVYFVNHRDPSHPEGYLMLAPYSLMPTPNGYSREEAGTLAEVDKLQKRMQEQCRREWEREAEADEAVYQERSRRIVDNLTAKMVSSATSEWDKEFIRYYLQVYRPEKRERYRQRFTERAAFLTLREMDAAPGRRDDEESVNLDRLELKP